MVMEKTETKKRVLYFIPEFPRISETFIEREVSKLIERENVDVHVLSLKKASGTTSEEVLKVTDFKRLDWLTSFKAAFYFITRFHEVVRAYGLVGKPFLFLKAVGYTKIIESYHPNHIHVHFLSDPSTIVLVASTILNVPFSISGHARDVFLEGTLIQEKAAEAKFLTICNTYAWKKCIEIAGYDYVSKIHKVFHGINIHTFEGQNALEKPNRPVIFLGGTRLVEKKGIRYMLEASKILLERGVDHQVDLVGPGPLYSEFKDLIKKYDLENTVYIRGEGQGTPFEEVKEYYKIADVFVFPAIKTEEGDADGVPTVVIEAAIAKLPIITTNAGGISDLIVDGETGVVVQQKDPQALATEIERLLNDKELSRSLGEAAYSKASKMFDLDTNTTELENFFLE